jgi:hypothetical protein
MVAGGMALGMEGAGAATRTTGVATDLAVEGVGLSCAMWIRRKCSRRDAAISIWIRQAIW